MLDQSALFLLGGAEQEPLPGVGPRARHRQPPLMALVEDEAPAGDVEQLPVIPGQLSLRDNQMELGDAAPPHVQLSLLGDPPPWELPDEPPAPRPTGRLARRRARRDQIPGQSRLF